MENEVTRRARCNFHKLIAYGFEKQVGQYIYHTIMMDVFNVEIHVDEEGNLSGKLYDMESGEEYVNHRIKQQTGEFVSKMREAYFEILYDIVTNCYDAQPFIGNQSNRIAVYLKETYGDVKIALIGYQPALLEGLSNNFSEVRILDLNPELIGKTRYGVTILDGDKDYKDTVLDWADLVLCTGSTVGNGSVVNFLDIGKEVLFYGTTGAGAAALMGWKRLCFAD